MQTPTKAPLPSHREASVLGGTSLSSRTMGSNGFSIDSESLSTQGPWQSSSAKLAVHHPRRLAIPSKYKMSPYILPRAKIKVSRLEADMYEAVLKMAESSEQLE